MCVTLVCYVMSNYVAMLLGFSETVNEGYSIDFSIYGEQLYSTIYKLHGSCNPVKIT